MDERGAHLLGKVFGLEPGENAHPHTRAADWRVYGRGPIFISVCTRLSVHDAETKLNKEEPLEVGYWQFADDQPFAQGIANPCPCPGRPRTHRHMLFKLL